MFEKYIDQNNKLLTSSSNSAALNQMREAISKGANVNCYDSTGETSLIKATKHIFYKGVKLLMENGANPNISNINNETPLWLISRFPIYTYNKYEKTFEKMIDLFMNYPNIDLNRNGINQIENDIFKYNKKMESYIQENFPDKYEGYEIKKDAKNFNL